MFSFFFFFFNDTATTEIYTLSLHDALPISGALAGLAGMSEVNGAVHRLQDQISPGYGFTAIIVAYLAKFRPGRVVVASILFGALILAGREIQPSGVPAMIQGIILFTLIVADVLVRYRVRIERRAPVTPAPAGPAAPPATPASPPPPSPAPAPGTGT